MQTTQTTRRFHLGPFTHITLALGFIASLAIGAAALTLTDQLPAFGDSDSRVVTSPGTTSDELYALEASQAILQADARHAAVPQMTSDEAHALEASLVAAAAAYQHTQIMQLTPDAAWAIEQSQLLAGSSEQRAGR